MERGEVLWFEPDPVRGHEQAGRRPAVLVSRDAINRVSPVVVVVPLTTYKGQRLYPSDILIHAPEGGLSLDSVALGLYVRAVDRRRLGQPLGRLGTATLERLEDALLITLDIRPRRRE